MLFNTCAEEEKVEQLKIYLLFMQADGDSSKSEMKYLEDIVSKMDLSDSGRQEFQAFLGQLLMKPLDKGSSSAIHEIEQLLGEKEENCNYDFLRYSIDNNKMLQAQTIWTLINLGYADKEYSKPEKEIVNYLVERWEMDPALVFELNDTADTILALTSQKEWVKSTTKPYEEIDSIAREIEKNIAYMFKNIEISIAEAEI